MPRQIPYFLVLLLCFAFGLSEINTSAMQASATPDPNGPIVTMMPEDVQRYADADATHYADLFSRSIFDYHVGYLIAEDAVNQNPKIVTEKLEKTLGAEVIHTWEEFIEIDSEFPFQVVLLHGSMADQVDREWMRHAYRNQVIIIGISITHETLAEVLDDNCIENPNPHVSYEDEGFIHSSHLKGIIGRCSSLMQGNFREIDTPDVIADWFAKLIVAETQNYGMPNPNIDQ